MKRRWKHVLLSVRDFTCALAVFAVFFMVLEADRTYFFPPPMLTLLSNSVTSDHISAFNDWGQIGSPMAHVVRNASTTPGAFVVGLLAVAFSAIVTVNLAVVRHLRCVHASPRRGAWRES